MAKYPGSFIINEVGTRAELANIYGVSERTIYRWLNKAAKESGMKPAAKSKHPRLSTLEKFKGTRKQLAKKYGVSERTAYRWLKDAKAKGAQIGSRQKPSKYPGAQVIINLLASEALTNKQVGERFDVSAETAARWIRRARLENNTGLPDLRKTGEWKLRRKKGYSYYERVEIGEPWEVLPPEEEGPWEVPPPDEEEDFYSENFSDNFEEKTFKEYTQDILNQLKDLGMIDKESLLFTEVSSELRIPYLMEYISYQRDQHPKRFYDVFGEWNMPLEDAIKDTMGMITVNIWGDELEQWLKEKIEIDNTKL